MTRFEENLRIWLKDYPKHIILAKCVSFRAYDHNNPKSVKEFRFWLLPLIVKYGFLYGKDGPFSQETELKFTDEILKNKILDNLAKWGKQI